MPSRLTNLFRWGTLVAVMAISAPAFAAGCTLGIMADLPVTMEGQRVTVPVKVNGRETQFWLDSGAFFNFMSQAKAAELGLALEGAPFGLTMAGIGGSAAPRLTTIRSFGIVGRELKNEQFLVGGSDSGNGFIGRNLLGLKDTEFDLADGSVKLIDPHGCEHTAMAYWAPGKPYFAVPLLPSPNSADHSFLLPVTINGTRLTAALDSGATTSVISRSAARRAGIDLTAPGVLPTMASGVGGHLAKGWVVPIANVTVGNEQTLNTHLDVLDDSVGNMPDMLLGADFIMAHHIYVARSQGRVYFTYSGGRPFYTSREKALAKTARAVSAQPPVLPAGTELIQAVGDSAGEPKTADGFARRGAARLAGHDLPGALADLSEAIRQSPGTAAYYVDRAKVYAQLGNGAATRGDIDQALTLEPGNAMLLRARAAQRLAAKDRFGALADTEAAARATPPESLASVGVATLFVRLNQPARAIPLLDAVVAAHRDDARIDALLTQRCWARALANSDLDAALADCNRAIKHGGASPDALANRGLVFFRQGNYPLAIADFNAALKLAPRRAWSLYLRGLARMALGQIDPGSADVAAAKAIRPEIAGEVGGYGIGAPNAKAP